MAVPPLAPFPAKLKSRQRAGPARYLGRYTCTYLPSRFSICWAFLRGPESETVACRSGVMTIFTLPFHSGVCTMYCILRSTGRDGGGAGYIISSNDQLFELSCITHQIPKRPISSGLFFSPHFCCAGLIVLGPVGRKMRG